MYASQNIQKGKYAENQMRGFKPASNPQGINPHFTFPKFTRRCPLTIWGRAASTLQQYPIGPSRCLQDQIMLNISTINTNTF